MLTMLAQIQNPVIRPGTGDFTSHSLEIILICLGMFFLGWTLYYLIFGSKYKATIKDLTGSLSSARTRISDLEGDLEGCNSAIVNIKGENAALSTKLARMDFDHEEINRIATDETNVSETPSALQETLVSGLAADIAGSGSSGYDEKGAAAVFGKTLLEDDLKIVEGIGPKTAQLLNINSIHTWKQLGSTSVPQLQNLLNRSGGRFQFLNPSTWPKQARMASEGEWVKLREYQDYLVGGVEPVDKDPPSSSHSGSSSKYLLGRKIEQDDLTLVDGIGYKIKDLLHEHGVTTWADLGNCSVMRLQEILDSAGDKFRMHNPINWPKQAAMAADGKWDELREFQEFLQRGTS